MQVTWRWTHHLPSLALAALIVLAPLLARGRDRQRARLILVVVLAMALFSVDGLSPLFLGVLAASVAIGLAGDWRRGRREAGGPVAGQSSFREQPESGD